MPLLSLWFQVCSPKEFPQPFVSIMCNVTKNFQSFQSLSNTYIANLKSEINQQIFTEIDSKIFANSSKNLCSKNVKLITDMLNSIMKQSGAKTKRASQNCSPNHKTWFDNSCKEAKSEITRLGKLVSREPKNSSLRTTLFEKKKEVKKMIKNKNLLLEMN